MIATDSTPLIYLAKLGHLRLLCDLFGEVIAPAEVLEEVLRGSASGHQEVGVIKKAKQDGWLKETKLSKEEECETIQLQATFGDISRADAASVVVARDAGVPVCLDDTRATKVAELLDVKHLGTLSIILLATERGLVEKDDARRLILELPERGFYVTHDLLAAFLEKLDQIPGRG